jgi:hypothetical protein
VDEPVNSFRNGGKVVTPLVIAVIAAVWGCVLTLDAFCLVTLARHPAKHRPKWAWAVAICVSFLAALAYLSYGKADDTSSRPGTPRSRRPTWISPKTASSTTPGARPTKGRPRDDNSQDSSE